MAAVSDDSASAPSVKRQRQLPASSSCAHSKSLAPPFHKDACGNHLRDKSRILAVWGRKDRKQLPKSYWDDKCSEMPSIDFVLEFFKFRLDHNNIVHLPAFDPDQMDTHGWGAKTLHGNPLNWHVTTVFELKSIGPGEGGFGAAAGTHKPEGHDRLLNMGLTHEEWRSQWCDNAILGTPQVLRNAHLLRCHFMLNMIMLITTGSGQT